MRVAVVHNAVAEDAAADERDVLVQAEAVSGALRRLGHEVALLACDLDLAQVRRRLAQWRAEHVFNLVESLAGSGRLIHLFPAMLEAAAIPFTGAGALPLLFTSNKLLAKEHMRRAGIPTPDWVCAGSPPAPPPVAESERWIVKSVWEHASLGIDADALVSAATPDELRRRLEQRQGRHGGPWFAERFVPGREFNLALLAGPNGGVAVLPPAEIRFEGYDQDRARIVDWQAKWDEASFAYHHTPRCFDFAPEEEPLLAELARIARRLWRLFDLRGYARVDFRLDSQNRPWVLEVNANPCLAPDAGFAAAAARAQLSFDAAVARILADRSAAADAAGAAPPRPWPERPQPARAAPEADGFRLRHTPQAADRDAVRALTRATGFFSADEIAVAVELVDEALAKGLASGYAFIFAQDEDGALAGYTCFGPIPCTRASFDLYWIAVAPALQGRGLGRRLLAATEAQARLAGGTRLYIETSCRPQYDSTRAFYERCGYRLAALLEDFYAPGDARGTFLKVL